MNQAWVDDARIQSLNTATVAAEGKCVIYWMQKEQRSRDNWALLRAIELANEFDVPVVVAFFVWEGIKNAYVRHFDFMLRGLAEVVDDLKSQGIRFVMRHTPPSDGIVDLSVELNAVAVITDQSYLALGRQRRSKAASRLGMAFEAVDAGVIVPTRSLSDKQLWAAHIARQRLADQFDRFLVDYPVLEVNRQWSHDIKSLDASNAGAILSKLELDASVGPVERKSGMSAALDILKEFTVNGVGAYKDSSHDPVVSSTSQLSAYLHYGQISSQRVAWALKHVTTYQSNRDSTDKYLDELITWRELSINYAAHNSHYNDYAGVPEWARRSLESHLNDEREYLYTLQEFEQAQTHDELWNAAQCEMVTTGRMHGYMRMYWAKKILEWTATPANAIEITVYLNDKYELDGREPNGYTGILWAIGGLHDRPWFEREVYGQIRYMNYNGAKRKFDVDSYIAKFKTVD